MSRLTFKVVSSLLEWVIKKFTEFITVTRCIKLNLESLSPDVCESGRVVKALCLGQILRIHA